MSARISDFKSTSLKHDENISTRTYKQDFAKSLFKEWINDNSFIFGNSSNREQNVWEDYPIVKNSQINSIEILWDEYFNGGEGYIPNPDLLDLLDFRPICTMDLVLPHKGTISGCIMITDKKKSIKNELLQQLQDVVVLACGLIVYEIDADWILSQEDIPTNDEIRKNMKKHVVSSYKN